MLKRCFICKSQIGLKEEFKRLSVTEYPEGEDTIFVHAECYSPKILEQAIIKVNDTGI